MYLYKSEHELMEFYFNLKTEEKDKTVEEKKECICQGLDEYCKNCGSKIG